MIIIKVLHVISGNDNGGGGIHVLNTFKRKIDGLKLELCLIGEGELVKKAERENQPFKYVKNKVNNLELIKIINEGNYNIVNFHGARACLVHKRIKNKIGVNTVVTVHSNFNTDFESKNIIKRYMATKLFESCLKSFDNYIVVSEYLEKLLNEEKISKSAYKVYNGVDYRKMESDIKLHPELEELGESFIFGAISRMHPVKNHLNMIRAFKKVIDDKIDAKLLLIGDGSEMENIKSLIKELDIEKNVILLGYKDKSYSYIPLFDLNILTSFSEGGVPPLSVLEGFVFEKTSIVTDVNGMRDILGDKVYYVDPNDVDSIYSAMIYGYKDENRAKKGIICREFLCDEFSIDKFCRRYYEAYNSIVSGGYNEK